jgi:hypothetical protein
VPWPAGMISMALPSAGCGGAVGKATG